MTEEQFPAPPWWYDVAVAPTHGVRRAEIGALNYDVRDGQRWVTYQLPENPVEVGSVSVAGYLFSNPAGELIDRAGVVAGTVDFTTGIIEINLVVSPDGGTREVQYLPAG
jgi:hypothetical protein